MVNTDVVSCSKCPDLVENRSRIVNGVGPVDADIVLVGEAPGENEDKTGEPFVGKSGSILNSLLEDANLNREDIRITNTVRCRPPDNRDPTNSECDNCSGYLINELTIVNPTYIVGLGSTAVRTLTGIDDISVLAEAGNSYPLDSDRFSLPEDHMLPEVSVCPHPAGLIYRPSYKENVRELFKTFS